MKLVINKGVRDCLREIDTLGEELNGHTRMLANPACGESAARYSGAEKLLVEERICNTALRMLSHASKGRRYPLMTEGQYPANPRGLRW